MFKNTIYLISWVFGLTWLMTACAGTPAALLETTVPVLPSATPIPPTVTAVPSTSTPTPQPTDTPEPTATASPTPDKTGTAQVEATQTAEVIIAAIGKELETVGLSTDTGYLLWAQEEPVEIALNSYGQTLYDPFGDGQSASDFVLKTDVTWESTGGLAVCGFIFRSDQNFEEGKQYQYRMLRLSGLPAWVIAYFQYGEFSKDISQVRTNGAINQDQGSTNKLILIAEGEMFTLYINDVRIGSFYDYSKNKLDGNFAFLANHESGETTCTFADTWIWALK
jgi:hypothetical protein